MRSWEDPQFRVYEDGEECWLVKFEKYGDETPIWARKYPAEKVSEVWDEIVEGGDPSIWNMDETDMEKVGKHLKESCQLSHSTEFYGRSDRNADIWDRVEKANCKALQSKGYEIIDIDHDEHVLICEYMDYIVFVWLTYSEKGEPKPDEPLYEICEAYMFHYIENAGEKAEKLVDHRLRIDVSWLYTTANNIGVIRHHIEKQP